MAHDEFDPTEPSRDPTFEDAVWVHFWLAKGGIISRIAGFLQCNQARITEIRKGRRHPGSRQAAMKRFGLA